MTYREQFAEIIESQVNCSIYVWGGSGEDLMQMTDAQRRSYFERKEKADDDGKHTKEQNIARCEALFQKLKAKGCKVIRAFDCSGLICWALKQMFQKQSRINANTIYTRCDPSSDRGDLKITDLKCGDLVFKHNGKRATHVGMYKGNLRIIDSRGRDYGVNERSITSDFNKFGVWPALAEDIPDPDPGPDPGQKTKYVLVKGNKSRSVWIRTGPGTGSGCKKYKVAHGGDTFLLRGRAATEPHWYNIEVVGKSLWITDKEEYTEVIEK